MGCATTGSGLRTTKQIAVTDPIKINIFFLLHFLRRGAADVRFPPAIPRRLFRFGAFCSIPFMRIFVGSQKCRPIFAAIDGPG